MKPAPAEHPRGIALIMVMMVVTVLAVLAGGFAYSMRVETRLARNAAWDSDLEWLARGGVEIAKWALSQRAPGSAGVDYLGQAWAGGRAETNEVVSSLIGPWQKTDGGDFRISIVDLNRKMDINSADELVLQNACSLIGVDASSSRVIVSSILDWRDEDSDTHPGGAEDEFYSKLDVPLHARNGPLDDLSELLLINGIRDNPGVYYGAGISSVRHRARSARDSHFEEPIYETGLRDLFCAIPGGGARPGGNRSGLLNINTASVKALQVCPLFRESTAEEFVRARRGPDETEGTEDDFVARSSQDILRFLPGVDPGFARPFLQMLGVQSAVFEVTVEVRVGTHSRTYKATIRRAGGANQLQTLNLYWMD